MTKKTDTQSIMISSAIDNYLEKGMTDKSEIYTKVVDELGVPRPTVRRVAIELRNKFEHKMNVLKNSGTKKN